MLKAHNSIRYSSHRCRWHNKDNRLKIFQFFILFIYRALYNWSRWQFTIYVHIRLKKKMIRGCDTLQQRAQLAARPILRELWLTNGFWFFIDINIDTRFMCIADWNCIYNISSYRSCDSFKLNTYINVYWTPSSKVWLSCAHHIAVLCILPFFFLVLNGVCEWFSSTNIWFY